MSSEPAMTNREFLRSLILGDRREDQLSDFERSLLANIDDETDGGEALSAVHVTIEPAPRRQSKEGPQRQ